MTRLLFGIGFASAFTGVALCAAAGILRLLGHYQWQGFETMTIFDVGVAGLVLAAVLRLYSLSDR